MENNRILVVDDDQEILMMIRLFFKNSGFEVDIQNDPRQVVADLKKRNYCCILLDMMMPELSGKDLLDQLCKDPQYKKLKIIVISMMRFKSKDIESFHEQGVIFLPKPFSKGQLLEAVRKAVIEETDWL